MIHSNEHGGVSENPNLGTARWRKGQVAKAPIYPCDIHHENHMHLHAYSHTFSTCTCCHNRAFSFKVVFKNEGRGGGQITRGARLSYELDFRPSCMHLQRCPRKVVVYLFPDLNSGALATCHSPSHRHFLCLSLACHLACVQAVQG